MGWVKEIADIVSKLSFFTIVHEWEQGLYVRRGKVIKKRKRLDASELEEIVKEEEKVTEENRGKLRLFLERKTELSEDYRRNLLGQPKHSRRYEKDEKLMPGIYFNIPIIEEVIVRSRQEKALNLGSIGVPTTDDENIEIQVSCNILYVLNDLYRAFTVVHDYENSLKTHALSVLAKCSRGKKYAQWKTPKVIEELEKEVIDELRKIVTKDWGLGIRNLTVTNNVRCNYHGHYVETSTNPIPVTVSKNYTEETAETG